MSIIVPNGSAVMRVVPGSIGTANFDDEIIEMRRVTNVTSGGRQFSFSTFVVTGNYAGFFGFGSGKTDNAILAKQKASNQARGNLYFIPLREKRTIAHEVSGKCGSVTITLKPARTGTGVIAAKSVKSLLELIGVKDIVAKCHGPSNVRSAVLATFDALLKLRTVKSIAKVRRRNVANIISGGDM